MKNKPVLAITMGDCKGVGPEIIHKGLKSLSLDLPVLIIGCREKIDLKGKIEITEINEIKSVGYYFLNIEEKTKSHNSFEFVKKAVELALREEVAAIVTAPISKENWVNAGINYKGHTEYLAETAGLKRYAMAFWSDTLRLVLYSIHIPLSEIFGSIKKDRIIDFIRFVNKELTAKFKKNYRFLVSGLNPHSGEGGIMGREEIDEIIPAIDVLKNEMDIRGPFPPDTVFLKALEVKDSIVISWYHDQGLIPFKLLNIFSGVNLTLGLPYVRTSPDHGTAFDIAGKGIADFSSMKEAILLAYKLI